MIGVLLISVTLRPLSKQTFITLSYVPAQTVYTSLSDVCKEVDVVGNRSDIPRKSRINQCYIVGIVIPDQPFEVVKRTAMPRVKWVRPGDWFAWWLKSMSPPG